jgi:hypothetical protein
MERGFIRMVQSPHLGPSGIGQSALWALDEESTDDMKPAQKAFMRWSAKGAPVEKPRTMIVPPRHSYCDAKV